MHWGAHARLGRQTAPRRAGAHGTRQGDTGSQYTEHILYGTPERGRIRLVSHTVRFRLTADTKTRGHNMAHGGILYKVHAGVSGVANLFSVQFSGSLRSAHLTRGRTRSASARRALTDRWRTGLLLAPPQEAACRSQGRFPAPSSTTPRTMRRSPRPPVPGPGSGSGSRPALGSAVRVSGQCQGQGQGQCQGRCRCQRQLRVRRSSCLYPLGRHERGAPCRLVLLEGRVELGRVEVVVDVARLGDRASTGI